MAEQEKFTQEQVIEAVKAAKGKIATAARKLGCDRQTIYNYAERYPEIQGVIDQERDIFLDEVEDALSARIKAGDTTAIIFALKTLGKSRGYIERQELTGKDGEPINQGLNTQQAIELLKSMRNADSNRGTTP